MWDHTAVVPKLYCKTHADKLRTLNSVCIQDGCKDRSLLCVSCCTQKHPGHNTVELDQLNRMAQDCQFSTDQHKDMELQKRRVKEFKISLLQEVDKARESINAALSQIEEKVVRYFQELEEQAAVQSQQLHQTAPSFGELNGRDGPVDYEKRMSEMAERVTNYMRLRKVVVRCSGEVLDDIKIKTASLRKMLGNGVAAFQDQTADSLIDSSFKPPSLPLVLTPSKSCKESPNFDSPINPSFENKRSLPPDVPSHGHELEGLAPHWERKFSLKHHHSHIFVNEYQIQRTKDNGAVCALGQTVWDPKSKTTMMGCRLHILNSKKTTILVGIAMEHRSLSNDYKGEHWSKTGHGNYLVSSEGQVFSHSSQSKNCQSQSIRFVEGNIAEVVFDSRSMLLRVSCGRKVVFLKVAPPNYADKYRLAVYLLAENQKVELVDDGTPFPEKVQKSSNCSPQ